MSPSDPRVHFLGVRITSAHSHTIMPSVLHIWGWAAGIHICTANTLPTESLPQPRAFSLSLTPGTLQLSELCFEKHNPGLPSSGKLAAGRTQVDLAWQDRKVRSIVHIQITEGGFF